MGYVVGIDPSFSRTGICVLSSDGGTVLTESIEVPAVLKKGSIYQFSGSFAAAEWHARECVSWLDFVGISVVDAFFIEYPALSSSMGAWLLPLQCMLYTALGMGAYATVPIYLIPPTAINSFILPKKLKMKKGEIPATPWVKPTKQQAKGLIVKWVEENYGVRVNHDEASAVVLAHLGLDILKGVSKIKYQLLNRDYDIGVGRRGDEGCRVSV